MLKVSVLYGQPQDPAAFDQHYNGTHIPMIVKLSGLKGFTVGKAVTTDPNIQSPYYLIASLYVDSIDAFHAIMGSPEGQAAVADLHNFATGGATILLNEEQVFIPVTLSQS